MEQITRMPDWLKGYTRLERKPSEIKRIAFDWELFFKETGFSYQQVTRALGYKKNSLREAIKKGTLNVKRFKGMEYLCPDYRKYQMQVPRSVGKTPDWFSDKFRSWVYFDWETFFRDKMEHTRFGVLVMILRYHHVSLKKSIMVGILNNTKIPLLEAKYGNIEKYIKEEKITPEKKDWLKDYTRGERKPSEIKRIAFDWELFFKETKLSYTKVMVALGYHYNSLRRTILVGTLNVKRFKGMEYLCPDFRKYQMQVPRSVGKTPEWVHSVYGGAMLDFNWELFFKEKSEERQSPLKFSNVLELLGYHSLTLVRIIANKRINKNKIPLLEAKYGSVEKYIIK